MTTLRKPFSKNTFLATLLVLAGTLLVSCQQDPAREFKIEVFSGEVEVFEQGAPSSTGPLFLSYEFEYKIENSAENLRLRFFANLDGQTQELSGLGGGKGMKTLSPLADTQVAKNERNLLLKVRESMKGYESWNTELDEGEEFTFLKYSGVTGNEVSYWVRLEADTETENNR